MDDKTTDEMIACACIGPLLGEPFCRCEMRYLGVYEEGDEWVVPEHRIPANEPRACFLGGLSIDQIIAKYDAQEYRVRLAKIRDPKRLP